MSAAAIRSRYNWAESFCDVAADRPISLAVTHLVELLVAAP